MGAGVEIFNRGGFYRGFLPYIKAPASETLMDMNIESERFVNYSYLRPGFDRCTSSSLFLLSCSPFPPHASIPSKFPSIDRYRNDGGVPRFLGIGYRSEGRKIWDGGEG